MKIQNILKKFKKPVIIVPAIFIAFILISFWIQASRSLSEKNTIALKKDIVKLIDKIRSNSYQLTNIINESNIDLSYQNLYQFYPTDIEKKSQELVIQLNKDSDNPYINKRKNFRDSVIFIRQSISNYKQALLQIKDKKYIEAKNLLKAADYYLGRAEKEISIKTAERTEKVRLFNL